MITRRSAIVGSIAALFGAKAKPKGSFTMSFRGQTTSSLKWSASAAAIKNSFRQMAKLQGTRFFSLTIINKSVTPIGPGQLVELGKDVELS